MTESRASRREARRETRSPMNFDACRRNRDRESGPSNENEKETGTRFAMKKFSGLSRAVHRIPRLRPTPPSHSILGERKETVYELWWGGG